MMPEQRTVVFTEEMEAQLRAVLEIEGVAEIPDYDGWLPTKSSGLAQSDKSESRRLSPRPSAARAAPLSSSASGS
jgi:hypothetical protein